MENHHFWAFFVIALIAGGAITLGLSNATMTGYALRAPKNRVPSAFWQTLFKIPQTEVAIAPEVAIDFEQSIIPTEPATECGKCGGCCIVVPAPTSEKEKVLLLNYLVLTGEIPEGPGEELMAFSFGDWYCKRCKEGKKGSWCGLCSKTTERDKAIAELLVE